MLGCMASAWESAVLVNRARMARMEYCIIAVPRK